jgi:pimeloyl-ACP methyl ester carboxylesterase
MTMTTTTTDLDSIELTLDEEGSGRPVLVLHGGGGPFTVAPIAAHFAADSRVVVPIHPGWQGTPRPESFHEVSALADAYLHLLADRDLTEVLVIGSSFGGWVAAEMAARDTEHRIARVVIIDGAGIEVPSEPMVDFASLSPREAAEHSWHDPEKFFVDPSTMPPERIAAQRGNMAAMAAYSGEHMWNAELQAHLGEVTIPVLVVWGDSDRVFTPGYGRAYAAEFPNGTFELIRDAGHLPQLEQPAATFAVIDAWLAE